MQETRLYDYCGSWFQHGDLAVAEEVGELVILRSRRRRRIS
jgi:hypothetical protein